MKNKVLICLFTITTIVSLLFQTIASETTVFLATNEITEKSMGSITRNIASSSHVIEDNDKETKNFETENKILSQSKPNNNDENVINVDDKYKTQLYMLNYLTVVTQDIKYNKNRLLLENEKTYDLYNKMHLEAVDEKTQNYIKELYNYIFQLRLVETKRERIEYILEQERAGAIEQAIPNPIGLLTLVKSINEMDKPSDIVSIVISGAYMIIDSIVGYRKAISNAKLNYLKSGWEINDNELYFIKSLNDELWKYKTEMGRTYKIPSDLILNEEKIAEFVKYKQYDNVEGKIYFFENNQETYKGYPMLWLILAQSYFEKATKNLDVNGKGGDRDSYLKCINAIKEYEKNNARIFDKDTHFAKIIPLVIMSSEQSLSQSEYIENAKHYLEVLERNMKNSDWDLQYFAAKTYLDIYSKTNDEYYLNKAYEKAKSNVVYLVPKQRLLNEEYKKEEYVEIKPNESDKDERKKEIKEYNKKRKEEWEKELPPILQSLELNLQLLFSLSKIKNIDNIEKANIDDILHTKGERLFLCYPLDDQYWFNLPNEFKNENYANYINDVKKDTFHIPVWYLYPYNVHDLKITYMLGNGFVRKYNSGYQYWVDRKKRDVKVKIQEKENNIMKNIDIKVDKETKIYIEFTPLGEKKEGNNSYFVKFKNNGKIGFLNGFDRIQ